MQRERQHSRRACAQLQQLAARRRPPPTCEHRNSGNRGRRLRRLPLLRAGAARHTICQCETRKMATVLPRSECSGPGCAAWRCSHVSAAFSTSRPQGTSTPQHPCHAIQSATLPKRLAGAALRTFFFALPPPEPALGLAAPFLSSFFGAIALRERMTSGAMHRHECRAGSERETRRQAGAGPATAGGRERVARHLP